MKKIISAWIEQFIEFDSEMEFAVFDAMFDKVVDEIAAELNITCQPDVCEEKGDDLKENLIEQVGNVHQGLAAILKFLS